MQFPQDGGLSCVRYYLAERNDALEDFARSRLTAAGRHVGGLICQCGADKSWQVLGYAGKPFVVLNCGCNGSSLPIYLGEPPFDIASFYSGPPSENAYTRVCGCGSDHANRIAIGIGYPGDVPQLGTLDVERAQEVVVAAECQSCKTIGSRWNRWLSRLPKIEGDEPWIRVIQGLNFPK
jgi:hypothetical protein